MTAKTPRYDFVIVGSGFGGSVAGLRLVEKGWNVLMLEKGRRFAAEDFPRSNWNLKRWLWMPALRLFGPFQMRFFKHITIFSGVGVGGGSLVYANTLPVPKRAFFQSGSWSGLEDWEQSLAPHYQTAKRMLGATPNPKRTPADEVLEKVAHEIGRPEGFEPTDVGVYFGEEGKTVPDPYFDGEGPPRTGCIHCGACMLGCPHGAKNTLDKNYLYLAEKRGLEIRAETEVTAIRPLSGGGYRLETRSLDGRTHTVVEADRVVLSGGVLGTVDLLLQMKADPDGLPGLSPRTGELVRTNSESLIAVVSERRDLDLSKGVAITSILHTDEHSHVEPCRYPEGSGFFRLLISPHAPGPHAPARFLGALGQAIRNPLKMARMMAVPDLAKHSQILLYMRALEGTIKFRRARTVQNGFKVGLTTDLADAEPPKAFIEEATDIARRFAAHIKGTPASLVTETTLGIPSTAHILGGACIGADPDQGVIDAQHRVHGYPGLYVMDGSAVSANPGVNPSLTITAMAERAVGFIPAKGSAAAQSS